MSHPGIPVIALLLMGAIGAATPAPGQSVHPELWAAAPAQAADPATEAFVEQLLSQMSVEEKV
ncbi:MAG TPA: hypothetical protein VGE92_04965, partial [Steroidobacteraceae bacterium]